ncbi:carbohydrate ABC transporter substrate-binding protein, partial [Candidatus Nomurabacteria bacterium]|nr:carbohydrate ABC transporter substrate-binding protein [Candidatus Nomurabacteria bacterium]
QNFEEEYNCTIVVEQLTGNTAETELIPRLLAGDRYDIIQAQRMDLEKLRLAGDFLYDMNTISSVDLNDEMWDQGLIKASTFSDYTYATYGELNYVQNGYFVNLSMIERLGLEDIYDLIENREWTLDKFREFCLAATKDVDNDGEMDQFGATLQDLVLGGITHANGSRIMTQETDGKMKYSFNSPKTVELLGFLRNLVQVDKVATDRSLSKETLSQMFMEGKIMFFGYPSWIASDLNEMEDDYAYIPMPIDSDMENYSYASDAWHPVLMIPKTNPEPENAGTVITEYFKMEDVAVDMVDNVTHSIYFRGNDRAMDAFKLVRGNASFDYGIVEAGFTQPWLAMINAVWSASGDPVALLNEIDSLMENFVEDIYN